GAVGARRIARFLGLVCRFDDFFDAFLRLERSRFRSCSLGHHRAAIRTVLNAARPQLVKWVKPAKLCRLSVPGRGRANALSRGKVTLLGCEISIQAEYNDYKRRGQPESGPIAGKTGSIAAIVRQRFTLTVAAGRDSQWQAWRPPTPPNHATPRSD